MAIESGSPSRTLYVSNLDSKVKKPDLIRHLYLLFSSHGPVLDVVATKTAKMRGQAHVVFSDQRASAAAMKALQGKTIFSKPMRIFFAKSKSNIITRLEGGVGASLVAGSSAAAGVAPSGAVPGAAADQASAAGLRTAAVGAADKQAGPGKPTLSIFNAPGGYIGGGQPQPGLPARREQQTTEQFLSPAEGAAASAGVPLSPRKRTRAEDGAEDGGVRKKSPVPPSDDSDDDEMEMSEDDDE